MKEPNTKCGTCKERLYRPPSKLRSVNYCSYICQGEAHRKKTLEVECAVCGKVMYRIFSKFKRNKKNYCSQSCLFKSRRSGKKVKCFVCNKSIYRVMSSLLKRRRHYCSMVCQSKGAKTGRYYKCYICGKSIWVIKSHEKYKTHYCSRLCCSRGEKGVRHKSWKGGRVADGKGYIRVYVENHPRKKDHYIQEHVLVMEKHLGRYLEKSETVHHINGIRDDNRLENLELWSNIHPSGQRVVDKIRWAKEILSKYEGVV